MIVHGHSLEVAQKGVETVESKYETDYCELISHVS